MLRPTTLACLLLFLTFQLSAKDYYIHSKGNDASTGESHARAWKTINRANRHTFSAGDRILFFADDTFIGNLMLDKSDLGSPENPIIISSYGTGRAVINAGDGTGIMILNAGNIEIRNLIVKGSGRHSNKKSGIQFTNELPGNVLLENIIVDHVDVTGFGQHGIFVWGAGKEKNVNGYWNVKITNCTASDNLYTGIWVYGYYDWPDGKKYSNKSVYIAYCQAFNNSGDNKYMEKHSGNGILVESTDGAVIERCIAYNNGYDCHSPSGGPVGIWTHASNNVIIQFNESHHNRTGSGSVDGGGFDFDAGVSNSIMQNNYSHDNDGAGFLLYVYNSAAYQFTNNIVRYNISQNDGRKNKYGAVFIVNDGTMVRDIYVYNNTFFTSASPQGTPVVVQIHNTENVHLFNNIILSKENVPLLETGNNKRLAIHHNNYWSYQDSLIMISDSVKYTNINSWVLATGYERDNRGTKVWYFDPQLIDAGNGGTINDTKRLSDLIAYTLKEGSPLIKAASKRSAVGTLPANVDFTGSPLEEGPLDIGACSFKLIANSK